MCGRLKISTGVRPRVNHQGQLLSQTNELVAPPDDVRCSGGWGRRFGLECQQNDSLSCWLPFQSIFFSPKRACILWSPRPCPSRVRIRSMFFRFRFFIEVVGRQSFPKIERATRRFPGKSDYTTILRLYSKVQIPFRGHFCWLGREVNNRFF